jgi:hypothetical protein
MGLKEIYVAIRNQVLDNVKDDAGKKLIEFCQTWNNQLGHIRGATTDNYGFPMPAVFIEIINDDPIEQLGAGYQFIPLMIRMHILHEFLNATDTDNGILDNDMTIFALRDGCFQQLNKFIPPGCMEMVRISETQDFEHDNVYHFIQDYRTNFVDGTREEPVGYILKPAPTDYSADVHMHTGSTFLHQPD